MNLRKEKIRELYLRDSSLENIFINEYLPAAPGDFVKVFVYGAMYAEYGMDIDSSLLAEQLGLTEKVVNDAWNYWAQNGAIRKTYTKDELSIEYLSLKEKMYGRSEEEEELPDVEGNLFNDESVKRLFDMIESKLARSLSSTEVADVLSWVQDEKIPPEVIRSGVQYSLDRGKTSLRYISRVVHEWYQEGYDTEDKINEHLNEVDARYNQYRRILRELGQNRRPSEPEKRTMDAWFDEMGYTMESVLEAAQKTISASAPSVQYLNSILTNQKKTADRHGADVNEKNPVSQSDLNRYYESLRQKAQDQAKQRLDEIYEKIPRIREIDDETRKLGAQLSRLILQGNDKARSRDLLRRREELAEDRAVQLTEHDFPPDYTDVHYRCDKCGDTGITDRGERCTCTIERMQEAKAWLAAGAADKD